MTIPMPGGIFNLRVGAIICHQERVLLVQNAGFSHYYTVGGRVQFGEDARTTLLREVAEETGVPLEIDRLAVIHENFFTMASSGEKYHELCWFFLMKPDSRLDNMPRASFQEAYGPVALHWVSLADLPGIKVYPSFLKTTLPPHPLHIITRDSQDTIAI